ncbi:hypothetical protein K438DRAFT_1767289 [Mycena galopus ATCC 62051]|nr:hypothetical protein K438DRAFT_1778393 [Mycena galopus ATCC 62051]KAF8182864.1 hypothetical protein K438DRAFT_1767289 [Mycena galopus ATCC 62051]
MYPTYDEQIQVPSLLALTQSLIGISRFLYLLFGLIPKLLPSVGFGASIFLRALRDTDLGLGPGFFAVSASWSEFEVQKEQHLPQCSKVVPLEFQSQGNRGENENCQHRGLGIQNVDSAAGEPAWKPSESSLQT